MRSIYKCLSIDKQQIQIYYLNESIVDHVKKNKIISGMLKLKEFDLFVSELATICMEIVSGSVHFNSDQLLFSTGIIIPVEIF